MVTYPFSTWNVMNNNMNPIAVTISGFMIGRLFACSIRSRISFFDLLTPIAAIVPATVEINVASSAILNVVDSASIISADSSICLYQRSENPVKLVSDFPSLNENIIMYRIGREKNTTDRIIRIFPIGRFPLFITIIPPFRPGYESRSYGQPS